MTKAQLQANFKITELYADQTYHGVISFLDDDRPQPTGVRDATTIINDEGRLRGYLECIQKLREIHLIRQQPEKIQVQPYSESSVRTPKPANK